MKIRQSLPFLLCAAALAGCAGGPEVTPALRQARSDFGAVSADPQVTANAPLELRRADAALRSAEDVADDGDRVEIDHRAYVASQRAEIARETAALKQARETVSQADATRAQALLQTRTQQADRAQARNEELERQINELQAQRTDRGILVTLGDVLFATGRAELTAGAESRLSRVAQFLARNPNQTARVEGYTDSTGGSQTNLRLSEQRAYAVRDALVRYGVDPRQVEAAGFGAAQPVADNSTQAGRQANRRVEIVISDPEGRVAGAFPAETQPRAR
jgi:outer membrane protein OmpA-like peptidoglycan-associated protein